MPLTNAQTPNLSPGQLVAGRYSVLRELGRGGMASVYLCRDRVTNEPVALKVLALGQLPAGPDYALWFHQEARALAALDHPSIVRARDFAQLLSGAPYLVMDAVEGKSIHVWKHRGGIPWPAVWLMADQVLAGLAHAHARGIIHGDLKPSNIMLDPGGDGDRPQAYILDLGLAWLLADHIDRRLSSETIEAPAMPVGGGTVGWLAPEQIRHATPHIGPPTDLYALGCTLFELMTGGEVYQGTPDEVLRAHRDDPVPEPKMKSGFPEGAAGFLKKLLAKRPWHRFEFAADARQAWRAFQPDEPLSWPRTRRSQSRLIAAARGRGSGRSDGAANHLAPGLLALRPCPLVGREKPRRELMKMAREMARGQGPRHRLCVLRGKAGLGKSRLAEWLCEYVHEHGLMIPLRSRYQQTPGPTDGLRGGLLRHFNLVGQSRNIVEHALMNAWEIPPGDKSARTWVAAVAHWLKPMVAGEEQKPGPSGLNYVSDNKPETNRMIAHYTLRQLAQNRPLLLWMDDLHLAPDETYAGMLAIVEELRSHRVMVVVTLREEAVLAAPQVLTELGKVREQFSTWETELRPLRNDETTRMIESTLPLDSSASEVVARRAEGNPLLALQLVHAWADGGHLRLKPSGKYEVAKEALHGRAAKSGEIWDARINGLPQGDRPIALAAAALGAEIPYQVLQALCVSLGRDVQACANALQQAQLLLPEAGQVLTWPHSLLQEHLMARLLKSPERHQLFGVAAEALGHHPDSSSPRVVRHRVQNLIRAKRKKEASLLLLGSISASWSRSRDIHSAEVALGVLQGHVPPELMPTYRRWKGEVRRLLGNLPRARRHAEVALEGYRKSRDTEGEAFALRLLAQIACDEGKPTAGRESADGAYALFLQAGNDLGRAESEFVLGQIDALLGHHERAASHLQQSAEGFRECGAWLQFAQCILVQARSEMAAGRGSSTRRMLKESKEVFERIGYQVGVAQVQVAQAQMDHQLGHYQMALDGALEARSQFVALHDLRGMIDADRMAALAAIDLGNLAVASARARQALQLATEKTKDPWGQVEALCILAQVALSRFDPSEAQIKLDEAHGVSIDDAEPVQHRALTQVWLDVTLGKTEDAHGWLEVAQGAFASPRRAGDHAYQLIARLLPLCRGTSLHSALATWEASLRGRASIPPPAP